MHRRPDAASPEADGGSAVLRAVLMAARPPRAVGAGHYCSWGPLTIVGGPRLRGGEGPRTSADAHRPIEHLSKIDRQSIESISYCIIRSRMAASSVS